MKSIALFAAVYYYVIEYYEEIMFYNIINAPRGCGQMNRKEAYVCMSEIMIRMAVPSDAEEILHIYAPYVKKTAITFEYEVPSLEEFTERISQTLKKYPYFVAVQDGKITGYAYLSAFHPRKAYQWAAETSIYIEETHKGEGIGKMLYEKLEETAKKQNIQNLNACIAYTSSEDEHLTNASVHFHEHLGYKMVGKFTKCGYKFGTWYDMVWMEKLIGEHPDDMPDLIPVGKINEKSGCRSPK